MIISNVLESNVARSRVSTRLAEMIVNIARDSLFAAQPGHIGPRRLITHHAGQKPNEVDVDQRRSLAVRCTTPMRTTGRRTT